MNICTIRCKENTSGKNIRNAHVETLYAGDFNAYNDKEKHRIAISAVLFAEFNTNFSLYHHNIYDRNNQR